jgi:hypothetical protein
VASDDTKRGVGIAIGVVIALAICAGMFALGWRIFF